MYSMPQHAVTKGYWKIEFFRAQPRASSRRLVKKDVSLIVSLPIQRARVPGIDKTHHQNSQKNTDLDKTRETKRAIDHSPWIKENKFDVEQDEQNSDQIELDREPSDWKREGILSALERGKLCRRGVLLTKRRTQPDHQGRDSSRQYETYGNSDVFVHGDTAQSAKLPGVIPPIKVTSAATASAAKTAFGKCEGAGSCASFMYMLTAMRM